MNREFADTFLGDKWAYNGPQLVERIGTRLCGAKDTKKQTRDKCIAFEVQTTAMFHPLAAEGWWRIFAANETDFLLYISQDSIAFHTWNSQRNKIKNVVNEPNSAYSVLAKKYCPRTFNLGLEKF